MPICAVRCPFRWETDELWDKNQWPPSVGAQDKKTEPQYYIIVFNADGLLIRQFMEVFSIR